MCQLKHSAKSPAKGLTLDLHDKGLYGWWGFGDASPGVWLVMIRPLTVVAMIYYLLFIFSSSTFTAKA